MPRITQLRLLALLTLLLASGLGTGEASALDGYTECKLLDRTEQERDCTFTEEFGQCAWNAYDSLIQCIGLAADLYEAGTVKYAVVATACEIAYYADLAVCGVTSPIRIFLR